MPDDFGAARATMSRRPTGTATACCGAFRRLCSRMRPTRGEILMHVFTRQIRNVGQHSRYIDGTLLEPGFELDELCAPVLALEGYLVRTGDRRCFRSPA